MPKITKKELFTRVLAGGGVLFENAADFVGGEVLRFIEKTARALGYEVTDAPELPERVVFVAGTTLLAEMVLRYNAKAEVLAIADELEHFRIEPDVRVAIAKRLRAAYGEKP